MFNFGEVRNTQLFKKYKLKDNIAQLKQENLPKENRILIKDHFMAIWNPVWHKLKILIVSCFYYKNCKNDRKGLEVHITSNKKSKLRNFSCFMMWLKIEEKIWNYTATLTRYVILPKIAKIHRTVVTDFFPKYFLQHFYFESTIFSSFYHKNYWNYFNL